MTKSDPKTIGERMRSEWDRRVAQDYRFWMSDGVETDEEMWKVGKRDFDLLLPSLDRKQAATQTALEIGCGVGRLLQPAAQVFHRVIGIDVSEEALEHAKRFLGSTPNVELHLGNGIDLTPVETAEVDVVFSFAALGCMPVSVIAHYLAEANRVLRDGGTLHIQVYLGQEQIPNLEDTLGARSFSRDRFVSACKLAGFELLVCEELKLPLEGVDPSILPYVVAFKKQSNAADSREIENALSEIHEQALGEAWTGSATEYTAATTRAQILFDAGDEEGGLRALELAIASVTDPDPVVLQIHQKLMERRRKNAASPVVAHQECRFSDEVFARNLSVLSQKFPQLAAELQRVTIGPELSAQAGESGDAVILLNGTSLDQMEKPQRAGDVWAERALSSGKLGAAESLLIVGFAGGFHLRGLTKRVSQLLHVLEPNPAVLKLSLGLTDLRDVLERVSSLCTTVSAAEKILQSRPRTELVIHPQTQLFARGVIDDLKRAFFSGRGFRELHPSIAVVGPIYGGSLPVARYTANALSLLGQRVSWFDMSLLKQPYFEVSKFARDKNRIAALQGHYVEMLSQVVIEGINERPVDIVICLSQAPLTGRALTELRNRGIITVMWFVEDCKRFTTWREISRYYDYMFLIQRGEILKQVEAAGAGRAVYLPVGCDPMVHRPVEVSAEEKTRWGSDISFVGAGYNNRVQMFASLAQRNFKIWGTEWPGMPPFTYLVQEEGRRIDPEEYIKIFNSSAVNLNLHSSMERDGVEPFGDFINPRTFELASCGAFQLVDERSLLGDMFEAGREVGTFRDAKEMEDKIDYFLAHPDERRRIAEAGRQRALRDHTYEQRLRSMLAHIYADRFEQLQSKANAGPWPKTLEAANEFPELKNRFTQLYERGEDPTLTGLVADIQQGKGALTETEQRLLFLFHVKQQIAYMNDLREGKS